MLCWFSLINPSIAYDHSFNPSQPPAYSETFFRSKIRDLIESGSEVTLVKAKKQLKSYILNL